MTLSQTKLVGLTMELESKAKEYKLLCKEFDELKKRKDEIENDVFVDLKNRFLQNQAEIQNILKQLKDIQS